MQSPETGPLGCRGSAWHELEKRLFRHCFNIGKAASEISRRRKNGETRVSSRADIWAARCPIGTGQTRVGGELIGEENRMRFVERRMARATLEAPWLKNGCLLLLFRINFSSL